MSASPDFRAQFRGRSSAGTAVGAGVPRESSKWRGRIVLAGDAAGALRPYGLSHGCDQL
jgi:2-polyprenyl-6-methoxyphenol hydroxylase-like FAD-dependent oxidoreductase